MIVAPFRLGSGDPSLYPEERSYRIKLRADLLEMKSLPWVEGDPLSNTMFEWMSNFGKALQSCWSRSRPEIVERAERAIHYEFMDLLGTLLRGAVVEAPLEERVHRIALYMATWLSRCQEGKSASLQALSSIKPRPPVSRTKALFEKAKAAGAAAKKRSEDRAESLKSRLALVQAKLQEGEQALQKDLTETDIKISAALESIRIRNEQAYAKDAHRLSLIEASLDTADTEIGELNTDMREIRETLVEARRENVELNRLIEETHQIVQKHNRSSGSSFGGLFETALGLMAAAAVKYYLGDYLKVVPIRGGAMASTGVPFSL